MYRNDNEDFYTKFDALDRFVKNNSIIPNGEAQIIVEDDDGFCAWLITREPMKTAYLVVANYKSPTEKVMITSPTGESYKDFVDGYAVFDKNIAIPTDYNLKNEDLSYEFKSVDKIILNDQQQHAFLGLVEILKTGNVIIPVFLLRNYKKLNISLEELVFLMYLNNLKDNVFNPKKISEDLDIKNRVRT